MSAEKGIFLDVLPRFDMAAMGAILNSVEGLFKKSGAAIGTTFGAEAQANIAKLAEAERTSANITEDAELRKTRAIHATEIAQSQASVATDKRVLAESRLKAMEDAGTASEDALTAARIRVEAATVAQTRATYAAGDAALAQTARTRDLAAASTLSAAAADRHSAAVAASAVTAGNAGRAFNVAGLAATGTFVVGLAEATKAASNFEVSQTRISVATQESAADIKKLHDGVLTLGPQIGQTAQDLENASFVLAKGGFKDANDQLAILKSGGQLARVELAPLDETMKGLTTTLTDFGLSGKDAPQVVSQLQVALGNAKVPMSEFMGSLHNVEPVFKMLTGGDPAKAANGIAQVTTALARMTANGTSADQASQNIRNSILQLAKLDTNSTAIQTLSQLDFQKTAGFSASKIPQMLTDPAVGYLGVLDKIHETIQNKLGPDGKVLESALYANPQAAKDLTEQYQLLDDAHRKMADAIQNGTIPSLKDLHLTEAEGQQGDFLKQWDKARQVVEGFNPILAKHGDLMRNALQLWQQSTGSTQGLLVGSQLYGSDEAASATNQQYRDQMSARPDKDGNIEGWGQVTDTFRFKLDAAKSSLQALAIQVGETFLPVMKSIADVLADVFGWLAKYPAVANTLMVALGGLSAVWLGLKAIAVGSAMWETVTTGVGGAILGFQGLKAAIAESAMEMGGLGTTALAVEGEVATAAAGEIASEKAVGGAAVAAAGDVATVGAAAVKAAAALAGMYLAIDQINKFANQPDNNKHQDDFGSFWDEAKSWMSDGYSGTTKPGTGVLPKAGPGQDRGAANPERRLGMMTPEEIQKLVQDRMEASGVRPGGPAPGMPDYGGEMPGGLGVPAHAGAAAGAAPVGSRNDPVFIDPSSITDGLNDSDMGSDGAVGGGLVDIFTKAGSGGFTLKNIATLMGTFVANLALGNPAGKLATGQYSNGGVGGDDLSQSLADIQNMTPAQRIEEENTIKMQKGIRAYKKALRAYAKAIQKYGPGSDQALDAEDQVLNARDSLAQTEINGQQAGGKAAQAYADDLAKGIDKTNPGKFARDQAAAQAYGGGGVDQALLTNVPAGRYSQDANRDLLKGLSDCSSSVGDLVNELDGEKSGTGGNLTTGNAATWLPEHGFMPGNGGPGDFRVGYNSGHMQATLPEGTPWNYGSDAAAARGGVGGTGADDSAFTQHYYRPVVSDDSELYGGGGGSLRDGFGQGPIFESPYPVRNRSPFGGVNGTVDVDSTKPTFDLPPGGGTPLTPMGLPAIPGMGGTPAGPTGPSGVGSHAGLAVNGVPITPGAAGMPGGIGQAATAGVKSSQPKQGTGQGGVGISQGLMASIAGPMSAMFPGSQVALQEANRAAQFMGQAIGIGAQGLLETFTLHGEDGAGGNGGWLGKIAGGLAGAHKSSPNQAGQAKDVAKPAPALKPNPDATNGQPQGDPNAQGGNSINIQEQHIHHDDGGAQNRDAIRQLMAFQ